MIRTREVGMNDTDYIQLLHGHGIQLNPQQHVAVQTVFGPVSVFAGPGSGKTTVLTCRLAYMHLVNQIPFSQCMVMTFTRAAAEEMKDRLKRFPGIHQHAMSGMAIGTFHSIFFRLLMREHQLPGLLSREEHKRVLLEAIRTVDGDVTEERYQQVSQRIGLCKNHLIRPEALQVKKKENIQFKRIFAMYEAFKLQKNKMDYDDILLMTYEWLLGDPSVRRALAEQFRYFVVDEFQDTNLVQYRILQLLASSKHIFVVGDDDQAIYGFRGANVKYLLEFQKDYPEATQIVLGTNYRSTNPLIEHSSALIQYNKQRWPKQLTGTGKSGLGPIRMETANGHDEAKLVIEQILNGLQEGTAIEQMAVLYRTHLQARHLVDLCIRSQVPFFLSDQDVSFYDVWYIRNIIQYLTLSVDSDNVECVIDIVNRPKRYVHGPNIREGILTLRASRQISALETLRYLDTLEVYQIRKLTQFQQDIKSLRKKKPKQAIEAILYQIGYMEYIEEYAKQIGFDQSAVQDDIQSLYEAAEAFDSIREFLEHVENVRSQIIASAKNKNNGLQLLTFHKAKGLEFEDVYIIGAVERMVPHYKAIDTEDAKKRSRNTERTWNTEALEEERRLFYVACTRAKKRLFISTPKQYLGKKSEPSMFLKELFTDS